jgi:hypothetical protein
MTMPPPPPAAGMPGDLPAELKAQAWQSEVGGLREGADRALAEVQKQVAELLRQAQAGAFAGDVVLAQRAARQLASATAELQVHLAGISTAHRLRFARPAEAAQ